MKNTMFHFPLPVALTPVVIPPLHPMYVGLIAPFSVTTDMISCGVSINLALIFIRQMQAVQMAEGLFLDISRILKTVSTLTQAQG